MSPFRDGSQSFMGEEGLFIFFAIRVRPKGARRERDRGIGKKKESLSMKEGERANPKKELLLVPQ